MGNKGLSGLCQKTPIVQQNAQHHPKDSFITQHILPCQICKTQFKHNSLKQHFDQVHYAGIKEEKTGAIAIQCILCGKVTPDLLQHGAHVTEKHHYAEAIPDNRSSFDSQISTANTRQKKRPEEGELNKAKKASVVKLQSEKDFQITKQVETNHYQASVSGVSYDVVKYSKEYRGADYNQQLMEAELVWFNIFKQKRKCRYYFLDFESGQRNILCKSYIFIQRSV